MDLQIKVYSTIEKKTWMRNDSPFEMVYAEKRGISLLREKFRVGMVFQQLKIVLNVWNNK